MSLPEVSLPDSVPVPRALDLDEIERYALDSAIEKARQAQALAEALASQIVAKHGWPVSTRVNYTNGRLLEVLTPTEE